LPENKALNKILFGRHTVSFAKWKLMEGFFMKKPNEILWTQEETTALDFLEQTQQLNKNNICSTLFGNSCNCFKKPIFRSRFVVAIFNKSN